MTFSNINGTISYRKQEEADKLNIKKRISIIGGFISIITSISLMYVKMNKEIDIFMFAMFFINTPIYIMTNYWKDWFDKLALASYVIMSLFILEERMTDEYQILMWLCLTLGVFVGKLNIGKDR